MTVKTDLLKLEGTVRENNVRIEAHLKRFSEHLDMEEKNFIEINKSLKDLAFNVNQIRTEMGNLKKETKDEIMQEMNECRESLGKRMDLHVTKHEVRLVWFIVTTMIGAGLWICSNATTYNAHEQMDRIHRTHQELLQELRKRK
jgi:hypothetical protein